MQILASRLIPVDFVSQKALTIYSHMLPFENAQIWNETIYSESLTNHLKVIISSYSEREENIQLGSIIDD